MVRLRDLWALPMCPHRHKTQKLESHQKTSPFHKTPPSLLVSTSQNSPNPPPKSPHLGLLPFHSGGFCFESAFSSDHHRFLYSLVTQGQVDAVSVEYRQAPEHFLPIAYEDCWAALQWVASHVIDDTNAVNKEPWLMNHGDFSRVFLGGDSARGNIVHNMAMRAGVESLHGGVKLVGAFLTHPYFWGSKPIRSEPIEGHEKALP